MWGQIYCGAQKRLDGDSVEFVLCFHFDMGSGDRNQVISIEYQGPLSAA